MFPHERSLVQRMASKPFALIGVNSDEDRKECKEKNNQQQITWRLERYHDITSQHPTNGRIRPDAA